MDIAQKKLDEVIARRVKIAELLIPARAAVEADKEATKGDSRRSNAAEEE